MALYTLPNGSTYNTGLDYYQQPDTGSYKFMGEVVEANTPVQITTPGQDPNLPRPITRTHTETSYTGSNYILQIDISYRGNSYISDGIYTTFTIEDK